MFRRCTISIIYWAAVIAATAFVLHSLGYHIAESVLIASLFLPGALALNRLSPQLSRESAADRIVDSAFIFLSIAVLEFFLIVIAHIIIADHIYPNIPDILLNPLFDASIILLMCLGSQNLGKILVKDTAPKDVPLTVISDRRKISIPSKDILYIESNDSEVTIVTVTGKRYRNKTTISAWESTLRSGFLRIHRSYLVNAAHIDHTDGSAIYFSDGNKLPISRKYHNLVAESLTRL